MSVQYGFCDLEEKNLQDSLVANIVSFLTELKQGPLTRNSQSVAVFFFHKLVVIGTIAEVCTAFQI